MKIPNATLVYPVSDKRILLGLKQKKVSKNLYSGYGGKQEVKDININETAIRELFEETGMGIEARNKDLEPRAIISFTLGYSSQESFQMRVFIYTLRNFTGTFHDTNEMKKHTWFSYTAIPYNKMLPDNKLFLPKILRNEYFIGEIVSKDGKIQIASFEDISQEELVNIFQNN